MEITDPNIDQNITSASAQNVRNDNKKLNELEYNEDEDEMNGPADESDEEDEEDNEDDQDDDEDDEDNYEDNEELDAADDDDKADETNTSEEVEKPDQETGNNASIQTVKKQESKNTAISNKSSKHEERTKTYHKKPRFNENSTHTMESHYLKESSENENLNLKNFSNSKSQTLHAISGSAFAHFESMLFDLLGFSSDAAFSLDDPCINNQMPEVKKINELNNENFSTCVLNDLRMLNKSLETNVFNELRLKKLDLNQAKSVKSRKAPSARQSSKSKKDNELSKEGEAEKKCKIITVILNQTVRPRKAFRIMLNKRNTQNLDTILNEICSFFRLEYSNLRKLLTLNGVQISDPQELFEHDVVLLVMGNEKTHNKDFELEQDEINQFFANEFMKKTPSNKLAKMNEKPTRKSSSRTMKRAKENAEQLIQKSEDLISLMPEDLLNNYEINEVIGEGHNALVRKCKDINTGLTFALKIIDLKKCNRENINNELEILRKVKHPNIVKIVEEYASQDYFYLIMEHLKGGDLLEAINTKLKYGEEDAAIMIKNLASAVSYLHSNNIVHRDLKLENILIQVYGDGSKILKIGDFGLATKVSEPLSKKCGSPVYVAPEILLGKSYGFEVDVWSLGVILYILLCGFAPFQDETDEKTFELIKNGELRFLKPYWNDVSEGAKDLIRKMLDRSQETRIKAHEILAHSWVSKEAEDEDGSEKDSEELRDKLALQLDTTRSNASLKSSKTKENSQISPKSLIQAASNKNYKTSNILSARDLQ